MSGSLKFVLAGLILILAITPFMGYLSYENTQNFYIFDTVLLTMPAKDPPEPGNMARDPLAPLSQPHRQPPSISTAPDVINIHLTVQGPDTRNYHLLQTMVMTSYWELPMAFPTGAIILAIAVSNQRVSVPTTTPPF